MSVESPNNTKRAKKKSGVKASSDVRFSDRGYAYAELGSSREIIGLISSFTTSERPSLADVPPGVLIHNLDTNCLELSDPENNQWIGFCLASQSGGLLGIPTDGTFLDGALPLNPSGSIADAIDEINEYLVNANIIQFASNLGTTNGNSNGFLIEPSFVIGRVASPSGLYLTNSWDNDTNRDITTATGFVMSLTPGDRITDLHSGTLLVEYYDGSNTLIHSETLSPDNTLLPQVSTPSGFMTISGLVSKGSKKEGGLSIQIPTSVLLAGNSGYLRTEISHTIGVDFYQNPDIEFFRDVAGSPSVLSQSGSLVSSPIKYLSGIKFATISGSTYPVIEFTMSGGDIWSHTYRADPVVFDSSDLGIPDTTISYNASTVTKAGSNPPISPFLRNEDFIYNENKEITLSNIVNPDENGTYKQVRFQTRDPFNTVNGSFFSLTPEVLVNTYGNSSTDNMELFFDENYRLNISDSGIDLLSSISGSGRGAFMFDSTSTLISTSGLQVINGALIYPQNNFSLTDPSTNPDYSSLSGTGDKVYLRRFRDNTGTYHSNGILRIDGLTEGARVSGHILIDIKVVGDHIPGDGIQGPGNEGTGWLSLNTDYNFATFVGDDGDGCFVTTNGYSEPFFEFTLGGFSTAFANNESVVIRMIFKDPESISTRITRIEVTDWS